MALRNEVQDLEFETPRGLDTTSPLTTMKPGYVRVAKNTNIGLAGGYNKRDGYANQLTTTVYGSRDVTFGIEYRTAAGTNQTIVFGTDGGATGGRYGRISGAAVIDITTGLQGVTTSNRPSFVQFDDLLFMYQGTTTPELYDGTSPRQIGITAPASAPTVNAQAGGGFLTPLGSYIYSYTYYNSTTQAESSPSALSAAIVLTGANNQITINIAAGVSTTADTIRIYRTVANGNTLFLDGTTTIASTTYVSTVADAGLGRQIEFDNSRITDLTSTAKFPTVVDNRVFVITDSNEGRFSKIGQSGPMPESFEVKSVFDTMGKFGEADKVVGMNRIGQTPIILKEASIGRLDPIGVPDITNSLDNVSYIYREISDTVGAVSHWAATQVLGELVFLSKDNIYATTGTQVRPIADSIQATIRSLGFTSSQRPQISAVNDTQNRRIYFTGFATGGAADPNIVLVGDYQFYPEFRWTTYEQGTNPTTHPGIQAGSLFQVTNTSTGALDVWFGNTKLNGKVYKMNSGSTDDSSAIYFEMVSRPYFGGNPMDVKLAKLAEVQARGTGVNYGLTIGSIFDLQGSKEDLRSQSLATTAALWDTAIWDTDVWSDDVVKQLQYYTHRKCKYWQLVFQQTEASAPIEIFSWWVLQSMFRSESPTS